MSREQEARKIVEEREGKRERITEPGVEGVGGAGRRVPTIGHSDKGKTSKTMKRSVTGRG